MTDWPMTEKQEQILIVDDDSEICELLDDYLRRSDFQPHTAPDCQAARTILRQQHIDLVLLDIMLPGEDGLSMCREMRAQSNIPIIMLTALAEEVDKVVGLEMGADDYLCKPFSARELLARVRAVLRRTHAELNTESGDQGSVHFAGWVFDFNTHRLLSSDGVIVPLSSAEFRLLSVFLKHPNRVLSRDQLLDLTCGREAGPFDRSIDVQVSRLRRRLGDTSQNPEVIKTVRNEGYMLAVKVEKEL